MYELARCSRCQEVVRLPSTETDWVRCQHCQSEYPIRQVLDRLTPALVPIPAPSSLDDTGINLASATLATTESKVLNGSVAATHQEEQSAETSHKSAALVVDEVKAQVRSPETLRAERRKKLAARRKQLDSPVFGFLKVALGGVAGLAIGQIILWWLPQPYQTDPLNLGPKLPGVIRFLAPESIRQPSLSSPDDRLSGMQLASDELAKSSLSATAYETTESVIAEPITVSANAKTDNQMVIHLADVGPYTLDELKSTLNAARTADRRQQSSNSTEVAATATQSPDKYSHDWYSALAELGRHVTLTDAGDPTIQAFERATLVFLGKAMSSSAKQLAATRFALGDWQHAADRRDGILICGTVMEARQTSHFVETRLKVLGGGQRLVDVIHRRKKDARLPYTVGDEVSMLGILIAKPSLYVEGYEGESEAIVLCGLVTEVATAPRSP